MVHALIVDQATIPTRMRKVIVNLAPKDSTPLHQDKPLAQNVRQDLSTHMMRVQNTPNANAVPPAPTRTYNDKNSALTAQKDSTRRALGKALAQDAPQVSSMRQLPTAASTTAAQDSLPPPTAHACSAQSAGLQGISHAPNAKRASTQMQKDKILAHPVDSAGLLQTKDNHSARTVRVAFSRLCLLQRNASLVQLDGSVIMRSTRGHRARRVLVECLPVPQRVSTARDVLPENCQQQAMVLQQMSSPRAPNAAKDASSM